MAGIFKLNGATIARVSKGDWATDSAGSGLDGSTARRRWIKHIWQADVLAAADFDTLYAQEGRACSIDTPAYGGRNGADYRRYFGTICQRVSGSHEGPVFTGVTVEFLVRL